MRDQRPRRAFGRRTEHESGHVLALVQDFADRLHLVALADGDGGLEAGFFGDLTDAVDGKMRVPDGPGLGCDPDPAVIARYKG